MCARLLPPQLAPATPRRQTVLFVIATLPLALGLLSIMVGQYADGLIYLAMALWMASRADSLPRELREGAEEEQREGWRNLATGPVSKCPHCDWVSYNGNATICAQCSTPLVPVPPRSLS